MCAVIANKVWSSSNCRFSYSYVSPHCYLCTTEHCHGRIIFTIALLSKKTLNVTRMCVECFFLGHPVCKVCLKPLFMAKQLSVWSGDQSAGQKCLIFFVRVLTKSEHLNVKRWHILTLSKSNKKSNPIFPILSDFFPILDFPIPQL